ncbi:LOB domain-containing protein 36 [Raphanus sativus]|uniref:LOB domain-containing protein 36 n=1 Tax=Raphanus sativus TaxID=3726 RepID=A0A6J0JUB5_RAPSA|nr:LOB domain-containing protein 36 [Raphanus sativus]XP_018439149.1 LOB domain-containing protein 36 [Raphanus sativus]KAJ4891030.1 LOB domain-containing protein 36 [Raphanus sativus]
MASSSSPCAACKFLRRKCTQECVFAPYFPPDNPQKFSYVHKVFGASNVAKLLNEIAANQREDAVNSLFYEAEARLRDPVYGCVGLISILQHRHKQLQQDLENAKKELAAYVGPQAMLPILQTQHHPQQHFMSLSPQPQPQPSSSSSASVLTHQHHNLFPMMAIPTGQLYHQQQQQIFEAQQLAVAREQQQNELFRAFGAGGGSNTSPHNHQNQPQVEVLRFDNSFDFVPTGSVTVTGFNQLSSRGTTVTGMSSSLALGGNFVDSPPTNDSYHTDQQLHHHQKQQHHEAQLFIPTQSSQPLPLQTQETQTQPNSESEEGRRSIIG